MSAMAADRNYRYPSARALQMDLEEFARVYRIALSSARLAHYMEHLFDAEERRWPTNPGTVSSIPGEDPTQMYDPRRLQHPDEARTSRPTPSVAPAARPPPPDSAVDNPSVRADIAAMDAALSRLATSDAGAEDATDMLGGDDNDSQVGFRDPQWMRRKQ
jgi:hypothetical protein